MLSQRNPRLRRLDIVSNSFSGCISDAAKEFSRAPEMPFSEIISQPGMLLQQTESTVTFKQLKSLADTHSYRHLDKQMDMVFSDAKFINFAFLPVSNLSDEELAIHPDSIELHRVHSILAFPHKVKSILPEGMFSAFQIHFFAPQNIAHAKFVNLFHGANIEPRFIQEIKFYKEGGNSSIGLKAEVSLPRM